MAQIGTGDGLTGVQQPSGDVGGVVFESGELLSGEQDDDLWADTVVGGSCSGFQSGVAELFEGVRTALLGGAVLVGSVGSTEGLERDARLLCSAAVQQPGEGEAAIGGVGSPHPARAMLFFGAACQRFGPPCGQQRAGFAAERHHVVASGQHQQLRLHLRPVLREQVSEDP